MTREETLSYAKAELKAAYDRAKKIGLKEKTRYIIILEMAIKALEQEPKTGHWIMISPAMIYECSECGHNVMTSDICAYKFCHGCGIKMVEHGFRYS